MVRVSSPAKLRPWSKLTAKMVGVAPGLVNCLLVSEKNVPRILYPFQTFPKIVPVSLVYREGAAQRAKNGVLDPSWLDASMSEKLKIEGCGRRRARFSQQPFALPESAQTLAGIAFGAAGKSVKNFPAASKLAGKLFPARNFRQPHPKDPLVLKTLSR